MPTGYTSYIEDGEITKGNDFLLKCARGFGACVGMREESLSVDIPVKFEPDTYHKERLENAYKDLEKYKSMTIEEAQIIVDEAYEKNQKSCREAMIRNKRIHERYVKVRSDVDKWIPPTSEHFKLKEFALNQIDMCMDDEVEDYYEKELSKLKMKPEEYIALKIDGAANDIKYHLKSWQEEVKGTEERNRWINDLRDSLK